MQINSNNGSSPVSRIWAKPTSAAQGATAGNSVNFDRAAALDRALADVPDFRPGEVERARALIRDETYPSEANIRRMASLFAAHLGSEPTET